MISEVPGRNFWVCSHPCLGIVQLFFCTFPTFFGIIPYLLKPPGQNSKGFKSFSFLKPNKEVENWLSSSEHMLFLRIRQLDIGIERWILLRAGIRDSLAAHKFILVSCARICQLLVLVPILSIASWESSFLCLYVQVYSYFLLYQSQVIRLYVQVLILWGLNFVQCQR